MTTTPNRRWLRFVDVLDPYRNWGRFTRYVEYGDDHFPLRHVDVYACGTCLRYDRTHWDDDVSALVDAKYDEASFIEAWGDAGQPIDRSDFEQVWDSCASAVNQPQQYISGRPWPVLRIIPRKP